MPFEIAFALTWLALLGTPLLGALWVHAWRTKENCLRPRVLAAAGFLLLMVLCVAIKLETAFPPLNFLFCLGALLAYWILAASTWAIRAPWLRISLGTIAWLPFLPSLFIGTIGALGLAFALGDHVSPPQSTARLDWRTTCEISGWGYAFSDTGYTVRLYRAPVWFPLRHELAAVSVNETDPGNGPASASCQSVYSATRRATS